MQPCVWQTTDTLILQDTPGELVFGIRISASIYPYFAVYLYVMDKAKLLEYADLWKICNTYTGSCLRSKHLSYAEIFVHPGQMQAKFSTTVAGLSPLTCSMYMKWLLQRRPGSWLTHSIDLILQYNWMDSISFVHRLSFMHFMGYKM